MTQNIKVDQITLQDLVKEALSIPDGWKEEVYLENGDITFSAPMTYNTYTAKTDDPTKRPENLIGTLESIAIDTFEEYYERKDGQVEVPSQDAAAVQGEYYDTAEIISREKAIENIADMLFETNADPYATLLQKIEVKNTEV